MAALFDRLKHNPITDRLLRRPPLFYAAARRTIGQVAAMDIKARVAWQAEQLAQTLAHARKLPGYTLAPLSDRTADWPVLRKADMLGREQLFATARTLPAVPAATGGTTGQPMRLFRNARAIAFEQATIDAICAARGIEPADARIAVLRGDSIKPAGDMDPPFWIDEGERRRIFSAHHLSAQTAEHYIDALRKFAPQILFCYPSSLAMLLSLVDESDRLNVPLVLASSEMLPAATVERARTILHADVVDYYGHAERLVCATAINGGEWRFQPAYGHVELQPAADGLARIIATSLRDSGQILVRYDTGDLARVPSHDPRILASVAIGILPFGGIEGREAECIDLPDGRRIIGLNHIPRGVPGAASVQLYHAGGDAIAVYVVPAAGFGGATLDAIRSNLAQKFPSDVASSIVPVRRPVREANGKAPLLLRAPRRPDILTGPELVRTPEENKP